MSTAVVEARRFTQHLTELLARERATMVDFILALAEFDGRRLWAELGYGSLFDFLHRELGMSAGAAFYRKTAAALVQRFPELVEALADGRLCITGIPEVAKVITDENFREILPRFFHRSKREAKEVAAAIAPQTAPTRRDVITTVRDDQARLVEDPWRPSLPLASGEADSAMAAAGACPGMNVGGVEAGHAAPSPEPSVVRGRADTRRPPVADNVEPLTANLRRVHMTVSERWVQKLEALRVALSHSHPAGRAEEITEYALDVALEHVARKKGLITRKRAAKARASQTKGKAAANSVSGKHPPRPTRAAPQVNAAVVEGHIVRDSPAPSAPARRPHIPAEVRRAVTARDEGRCQWKLHDGSLCGSNVRVEMDHIHPVALGGASTVENLRLLCGRHNQLAARRVFGDRWIDQFTKGRAAAPVTRQDVQAPSGAT